MTDDITVVYKATLRYSAEEVEENNITEQTAIEILTQHIKQNPGIAGEYEVES